MKLTFILVPLLIALVIWTVRTKKYAQALLGLLTVGEAFPFYIGIDAIRHDNPWFGAAMLALSLLTWLSVVFAILRLRSNAAKTAV